MPDRQITKLESEYWPYAFWTEKTDPATGRVVPGYGSNAIFRFPRPVMLKAMELDAFRQGGDVLKPESVVIETFRGQETTGEKLFAGPLDWRDEKCKVEFSSSAYVLAVSMRCDRKTPVSHLNISAWDPAEWNIPFNFLKNTRWYGSYEEIPELYIPVCPELRIGKLAPRSSSAVEIRQDGMFVHFKSRYLRISFSLKRPLISHLSWDAFGEHASGKNFLANYLPCHGSGPWALDLIEGNPPFHWGGRVDVEGNRIIYHDLTCREGLILDIEFEIQEKGMTARITQHCVAQTTLLEAAAWRFVWDAHDTGSVSTLARPTHGAHRNGYTEAMGGWHISNKGVLTFEVKSGPHPVLLHTENTGFFGKAPAWNYGGFGRRYIFSQIQIGARPEPFGPVTLLSGTHTAEMRFTVDNVEPLAPDSVSAHVGLRRAWGSGFLFRPEQSGFANNSHSALAVNCLHGTADMAVYTSRKHPLPDMMELLRYTTGLVLKKGGPHYGSQFDFHHDSAPALIIATGRIFQAGYDKKWLKDIWPCLKTAIDHILGNLDKTGMYTARFHSGNSGDGAGSGGSNAWDDIAFGHHDGYSAALAYRALYNAAAMAISAGQKDIAQRCLEAAPVLKQAYVKSLYNPQTGWLAGWRSRDGELHDYGFIVVNALAVCYGILNDREAVDILARLETKRREIGHTDFRYGVISNLLPVRSCDITSSRNRSLLNRGWRSGLRPDGLDTFGVFCNGCLMPVFAGFYIRALSKYGFSETADQICNQMLDSFEQGVFDGDRNGVECFSHDGTPCGYEGTLIHSYYVLAEIAKHKGWVKCSTPEYWPPF